MFFFKYSRTSFALARRYVHTASSSRLPAKRLFWGAGAALAASTSFALILQRNTIRLDADIAPSIEPAAEEQEYIIDPASGIKLPKTIKIASKTPLPTLTCLGVGIRTVSILRIQVYSVGFYADLNNPDLKLEPTMTPDEKIREIVNTCACQVRIVPTRNTSYTHLRDAFIRAIGARLIESRKNGTLTEEQAVEVAAPIRKLKTLFPNTPLVKHSPLDVLLLPPVPGKPRVLAFRDLGVIENDWVATELMLHYFEGDGLSPPLKKMVVESVKSLQT
ncbi:hypothetical protein BT96DRAFT_912203 [Gymnopus androsaceus JB14]|uniref:Chalcone isomerase domain-containing protein n=1 Tax=Gymnopus androsaceus JB14 TaxID=1447944 RepID=A0A6A4IJT6_9AGAR|nr:hypothetical protein BT96DRAFT_912203 [Gymnopus androsaceus JB14]